MEYKQLEGVNQSSLKKILTSPKEYQNAVKKQKEQSNSIEPHFVFGTIVDIMLTGTRDEFDEKFVKISDKSSCSETVENIVKEVYRDILMSSIVELPLSEYRSKILEYANYLNYYSNWKDDTRIDKIIKEGSEYFDLLVSIGNRTTVTESLYVKAVNCVAALKSDTFTKKYVVKREYPDSEFLDKFVVQFVYKGVLIKGELDRVIIDHANKQIIPIDFKTTGSSINSFVYDFWKYRYDFQAATYTKGLYEHPDIIPLLEKFYSIQPFLYIVVESELYNNPMVFETTLDVINVGFNGGMVNNRNYEGFDQAINRYIYAIENNAWEYPVEYYLNQGKILITV